MSRSETFTVSTQAQVKRLIERVASLVIEVLNAGNLRYTDVPLCRQTIGRAARGRKPDMLLSTLVTLADALGCDVVINFRERRPNADQTLHDRGVRQDARSEEHDGPVSEARRGHAE